MERRITLEPEGIRTTCDRCTERSGRLVFHDERILVRVDGVYVAGLCPEILPARARGGSGKVAGVPAVFAEEHTTVRNDLGGAIVAVAMALHNVAFIARLQNAVGGPHIVLPVCVNFDPAIVGHDISGFLDGLPCNYRVRRIGSSVILYPEVRETPTERDAEVNVVLRSPAVGPIYLPIPEVADEDQRSGILSENARREAAFLESHGEPWLASAAAFVAARYLSIRGAVEVLIAHADRAWIERLRAKAVVSFPGKVTRNIGKRDATPEDDLRGFLRKRIERRAS